MGSTGMVGVGCAPASIDLELRLYSSSPSLRSPQPWSAPQTGSLTIVNLLCGGSFESARRARGDGVGKRTRQIADFILPDGKGWSYRVFFFSRFFFIFFFF